MFLLGDSEERDETKLPLYIFLIRTLWLPLRKEKAVLVFHMSLVMILLDLLSFYPRTSYLTFLPLENIFQLHENIPFRISKLKGSNLHGISFETVNIDTQAGRIFFFLKSLKKST